MTIGQRIMQIRISCGLSQEEFGERLGTSRQTVSKWELDITVPEVEKLVKIARCFSVSTDSILVDGISTFDEQGKSYPCGIYRSPVLEIVETERVALVYDTAPDKTVFGARAYVGFDNKKQLRAICEYHADSQTTDYAYTTDTGAVYSNSEPLKARLGEAFDASQTRRLYRAQAFAVSHGGDLPTVSEAGIKACLTRWRMSTTLNATAARFSIFICTDRSEYAFDIAPKDANIYCAVSNNQVTDLGLLCGSQRFRIRNYKDNREKFCNSFCSLESEPQRLTVPTAECVGGQCVTTSAGQFCGVKRYTDDEIILCGCGDDEYRYSRLDKKLEHLTLK